jgi:hypothetical protein
MLGERRRRYAATGFDVGVGGVTDLGLREGQVAVASVP